MWPDFDALSRVAESFADSLDRAIGQLVESLTDVDGGNERCDDSSPSPETNW